MKDKIEGSPSQHKPFRVRRDAGGSANILRFVLIRSKMPLGMCGCKRGDWRYFIHDGRKVVWPESRAKVE